MPHSRGHSRKKSFLLVGGGGFLGRHVARALADSWDVRILDRPGLPPCESAQFLAGDIGNANDLDAAMLGCEGFAYLAHETGISPYLDSDRLALTRNLELFLLTIEAARRTCVSKALLFSSGGAVYGIPDSLPVSEDHPLHPISAYGVAKASMEMYLAAAARTGGMSYLIVRPSNPYGPGQNPLRRQGAIAVFTHRILHGLPIELWGDGNAGKDYIYVEDFAEAVAALIEAGFDNRAYNIGSGARASLNNIITLIEEATGKTARVEHRPPRPNDVPEFALDTSRLLQRTGWSPKTSLKQGIQHTVDWQRAAFPPTCP